MLENIDLYLVILLEAILLEAILGVFPLVRDRLPVLGGIPNLFFLPIIKKLNRPARSNSVLIQRSLFLIPFALGFAVASGYWLAVFLRHLSYGSFIEVVLVFSCLTWTRPWRVVPPVIRTVKKGQKENINKAVRLLLRHRCVGAQYLSKPDQYSVARITVEDMAMRLSRGLIAPAFWYLAPHFFPVANMHLAGLFVFITMMEIRRITVTVQKETAFERPIGFIDEVLHYIPARLAAIIIWIAAVFSPSAHSISAIKCVIKQGFLGSSAATAWLLASFAGSLKIVLAGTGKTIAWIGPENASAKVTSVDIKRALWLYTVTCLLFIGILVMALYNILANDVFL